MTRPVLAYAAALGCAALFGAGLGLITGITIVVQAVSR